MRSSEQAAANHSAGLKVQQRSASALAEAVAEVDTDA